MAQMMENPMVLGDYYRLSAPLPDTEENRLAYISEQNLGWQAAAAGLRVEPFSRDAIRDYLEEQMKRRFEEAMEAGTAEALGRFRT